MVARRGLKPQKAFEYVFVKVGVVILQKPLAGPVTSVSAAVHSVVLSGVPRCSGVLLSVFGVSSSTFSHVACWCFCQYPVWPPGGAAAATVCMPSRSFRVGGPRVAAAGRLRVMISPDDSCFMLVISTEEGLIIASSGRKAQNTRCYCFWKLQV